MLETVKDIVKNASDEPLAIEIIESYLLIEKQYFLKEWKTSEIESGHFVESIRRYLEYKLFNSYTPLSSSLSRFSTQVLTQYEQAQGHESYRIIIPRVLFAIYCIRNKRGVGHVSDIKPNHQDATNILSSCKWVLAELVRIESALDPNQTLKIIEKISQRDIEGIWNEGDIKRILVEKLNVKDSVLFLLFESSPLHRDELQSIIEYSNKSYFTKQLKELHKMRFLELTSDNKCFLSPKGRVKAEEIILQNM